MENYYYIFESENICYIKMNETLINEYLKMYTDVNIQRQLFKKEFTLEQIVNWIKKQLLDNNANIFSMIDKSTQEYIGNVEIILSDNNSSEIIISITPEQQDRHFGTEAMESIVQYCYDRLAANFVYIYVKKDNTRAIHCYENVGFVISGEGISEEDIRMIHHR